MRFVGSLKRLKQFGEQLWHDAGAGVGHPQNDFVWDEVAGESENAALGHGVDRVIDHVTESTRDTAKVDVDVALLTNVFHKFDVLAGKKMQRLSI